MNKILYVIFGVFLALLLACCGSSNCSKAYSNPDKNRKIAVQMWSLHDITLEEAVKKLKAIGIDAIECYPGQLVSDKLPNVRLQPDMTQEQINFVKKMLSDAGMKVVSFGVAQAKNEKQVEQLCIFARKLGVNKVLTESRVVLFPVWQKYCEKYDVYMCLHHHALDAQISIMMRMS